MFVRTKYLFMVIFLLCLIGTGSFCLMAGVGESGGKKGKLERNERFLKMVTAVESKGKAEITWLYPPKYHAGSSFSGGRAWVREEKDGPWSLLDDQGNVLKTGLEASRVSKYKDGIASFLPPRLLGGGDDPSRRGFLNRSGDVVMPPGTCDGICGPYREGLIARRDKSGLCGFIDLSGAWVIPPAYDEIPSFSEGLAAVEKEGKYGYIDKKGGVAIDFKFDDALPFSHKMAPVQVDSKWGVIGPEGQWIAEPIYDDLGGLGWSDLIALEKDGNIGFINSKGDVVIDFQYSAEWKHETPVYVFNRGRAIVILDPEDWEYWEYGVIDESGKVLFWREGCEFYFLGDYILCSYGGGRNSLFDRESREYDLPNDLDILNASVDPDEKEPYPFATQKDGKIGYFTISLNDD